MSIECCVECGSAILNADDAIACYTCGGVLCGCCIDDMIRAYGFSEHGTGEQLAACPVCTRTRTEIETE